MAFGVDLDWKYHSESRIFNILGDFREILGIIREEGGGWDLLKYSWDSRMIREGWQHCVLPMSVSCRYKVSHMSRPLPAD